MKNISEFAKKKMAQVTNNDFVVLWGGSNKANPISMKWQDDEPQTKETTTQLDDGATKRLL